MKIHVITNPPYVRYCTFTCLVEPQHGDGKLLSNCRVGNQLFADVW